MANDYIYLHLKFHRLSTYPAGNLNHRENPSLKTSGYKAVKKRNMLFNSSHNPCSQMCTPSFVCTSTQSSSGLGPAKPQTSPRMEIPQPLREPVPLFYHPHGNCLFLTPHLNSPGSSLCLLPHILLLLSGKSWALSTHCKTQLWKKNMGLTYTFNCRNNKYCTLKRIRIREAYDIKSQNTSCYYESVSLELIYHPLLSHKLTKSHS